VFFWPRGLQPIRGLVPAAVLLCFVQDVSTVQRCSSGENGLSRLPVRLKRVQAARWKYTRLRPSSNSSWEQLDVLAFA
jgi:hypothetical protein